MTEEQISAEIKLAGERVATVKASLATGRSNKTAEQEVSCVTSKYKAALGVGILLMSLSGCGRPTEKARHFREWDCVKITKPWYKDYVNYCRGRGCDQFNASMVGQSSRIRALVREHESDEDEDDPEDISETYYYRVFGDECWFKESALEFSSQCPTTTKPHGACTDTCCNSKFFTKKIGGDDWSYPLSWVDKWGNGCDWYEKRPSECLYEGGNSYQACCGCGGGNPTTTAPPEDQKETAPGAVAYQNHVTTLAVMKRMPVDGSKEPIAPIVNQSVVIMM